MNCKKIVSIIGILLVTVVAGCAKPTEPIKETRLLLGTIVNITAYGASYQETRGAVERAFSEISRLEAIFSKYRPESEISSINNSKDKTKPIKMSNETFYLIKKSIEFSKISDGAFDITVAPLLELWGFGKTPISEVPQEKKIREVLKYTGFDKISLDEAKKTVSFKDTRVKLDLGGIAVGYAVDRAIMVLKESDIKSAIIDAGGDVYCLGDKVNGHNWQVGIQHPRDKNKLVSRIGLKDKGITTSGDYERYFTIKNKRYSHIVNPKTGYPVEEIPMSVTVISNDCISADALATAVFVLGPGKGLKLLNSLQDTSGIIISRLNPDGYIVDLTDNLKGKIKFRF